MIRESAETSPPLEEYSADFFKKHSETIEKWLDVIDRKNQVEMLYMMRDRISVPEFNSRFGKEASHNHYDVVGELRDHALVVKISNSVLQPESSWESANEENESDDTDDNWYHLTPLGLEFLRSVIDPDGLPLLRPILIADDLEAFIKGVPDEARRIDEHLVRTDCYETETKFNNIREEVVKGQYRKSLAPSVIPENPYVFCREMDMNVYKGANTLEGHRTVGPKIADAIRGRTQVRLFGPWAPTRSAKVFEEISDPNMSHQFIAGQEFIDRFQADNKHETLKEFFNQVCDHPDIRVKSTPRYLPYILGILENKERTDCELFIWGRGNPKEDKHMVFATTEDPSPELYNWATKLFDFVDEYAEEYTD